MEEKPKIDPIMKVVNDIAGVAIPVIVEKTWGHEAIIKNDSQYCLKILVINPDHQTSLHFHKNKHETMYVSEGSLKLEYIDNKVPKYLILSKGRSFIIPPGFVHRLICESDVPLVLIECSTESYDNDSIRIA